VLSVLLFHDNRVPGGFLGVDLFFVLSGFLITSLLIAEWEASGRIDLRRFWVRRATRLLPASFVMLAVVTAVLARTGDLGRFRGQMIASVLQVANWHSILSAHDYWDLFKAPSPFEHMWSLAIEEQFYLLWPLFVLGVLRLTKSRAWLLAGCLAGIALSCFRFEVTQTLSHSRAYFGTDTRAQALLIGALVACVRIPTDWSSRASWRGRLGTTLLAVVGLVVFVGAACCVTGESAFLYRGGFTAFAVVMASLIGSMTSGSTFVSRALAWRPLTALGHVSYGVYLWHWPVFCWLTIEHVRPEQRPLLTVLRLVCTLGIALLSSWLIEQPLRTRKAPRYAHRYAFTLLVVCVVGYVASLRAVSYASAPPQIARPISSGAVNGDAEAIQEPVTFQMLLLGDSTANSLGWALRGVHEPGVAVDLRGKDGCTMLADMCGGSSWAQDAKDVHPHATLVFLGGAFLHGLTVDGHWRRACHRSWDGAFQRALGKRLGDLSASEENPSEKNQAKKHQVWAVTVPYALGPWDSAAYRAQVDCINAGIRSASASVTGVRVLELGERLCPKGVCERELDGVEIRPDGVHFSVDGAAGLSRWVLEQVQR
jgi:peptidoglycan/LPS O-acetylase OafA/YrhL